MEEAVVLKSVFPRLIEDDVFICGFNSPKSYGATSYFIRHPDGNWMVDAPRYVPYLVDQFESMGGLKFIFLTHRDDVGDADLFAEHFQARRIIHEADKSAVPGAEILIKGSDPVSPAAGFKLIPVPGHTRGHMVFLYNEKFLFTGDHLEWDRDLNGLGAYRDYCWYDWGEQTKSMERLLAYKFEWVLPGHGHRQKLSAPEMREELAKLVVRMKQTP
jgi:glyoxylase-like metal-dependent hydrolase (beta-lactamase superfamily II)